MCRFPQLLHLPTTSSIFFWKHPSPPPTYTLSLHDALPISILDVEAIVKRPVVVTDVHGNDSIAIRHMMFLDRKTTRLNSSHVKISYAVFCLKKKTLAL